MFHCPRDPGRSQQWIQSSNRRDLDGRDPEYLLGNIAFCGAHFENHMFMTEERRKLTWNAVPTLFLWKDDLMKMIWKVDRAMREKKSKMRRQSSASTSERAELTDWLQFVDMVEAEGIHSLRVRPYLRQFIEDMEVTKRVRQYDSQKRWEMDVEDEPTPALWTRAWKGNRRADKRSLSPAQEGPALKMRKPSGLKVIQHPVLCSTQIWHS